MKAVGFKNFRNFEEFPMMPIEGVTFLVGQNNSGKSTFTKACRFLAENLIKCILSDHSDSAPHVSFASTCKTFERALYAGHKSDLEFHCIAGYFDITIRCVASMDKQKRLVHDKAVLSHIRIEDTIDDCVWSFDYSTNQAKLEYSGHMLANMVKYWANESRMTNFGDPFNRVRIDLDDSRQVLSWHKSLPEEGKRKLESRWQNRRLELEKFDKLINTYETTTKRETVLIREFQVFDMGSVVFNLDSGSIEAYELTDAPSKEQFMIVNFVQRPFFDHLRDELRKAVSNSFVYCPAHESPLRSYFLLEENTTDFASVLIQRFYHSEHHESRKKWICEWMRKLNIGSDFEIRLETSEFLGVYVTNMAGFQIPLSDLGRGAVQLFLMLLRVNLLKTDDDYEYWLVEEFYPMAIDKRNKAFVDGDKRYRMLKSKILIFEEPEQNLHPALQSKLADLFADIHKKFGYDVIVETHSEYMIRRTQALIASGEFPFEKNPFHVYYFPQGGLPYDMKYTEAGFFEESFDPGFYDTASELTLTVLKGRNS